MSADAADPVIRAIAATPALAPWLAGDAPGTLWVAFSGGRDSAVLLHALRGLNGVAATHIDHGLHPDSASWARHCAGVAEEWDVRLHMERVCVAPTGNREAEARRKRYAAWQRLLEPGDVLAMAHHADDQIETRLWQVLTGREPGGMPAERGVGEGRLVRPMFGVRRSAITQYAERHGLAWIEDPSNADLRLDRNYIRARLVPLIEERFPDALQHLARPRPKEVPSVLKATAATRPSIREWLRNAGLPVAAGVVDEIRRQSDAPPDRTPQVAVAPGVRAWRHAARWHLVRDIPPLAAQRCTVGCTATMAAGTLAWKRSSRGLPHGIVVTMRPRVGGERLRVDGRNVRKSVKSLLREAGVPPWRRQVWPLLYAADDRLVAVAGLAVAADAAIDDGWWPAWSPIEDF